MMLKLALFSRFPVDPDAPRGGVETVTLALVRALVATGEVEVHVVTLEKSRRRLEVTPFEGARVHRLPGSSWPQALDILAGPGRRRLRSYLGELRADLVHFHESYALGIGRIPMPGVFTIHGFDHANIPVEGERLPWLRAQLWRRIEERGLARQRHVISITPYVRGHIAARTRARIFDIDNPVDPRFFAIPRREAACRVFAAGWISQRKNTLGLVQAVARVRSRGVPAQLHLAGEPREPDYGQQVRDAIRELKLEDGVRLLGRIGPVQIREQLAEAAVFALPSRQENAPMAIAEAMAAGVPVVSSNVCGMPFMVDEGRSGFLVDPEDTEALAERLARVLSDAELRASMARAGRAIAERRFHPDAVAAKTLQAYRAVLADAEAPVPRSSAAGA